MTPDEKLIIIRNWCHKFEYIKREHVTGVTGRVTTVAIVNPAGTFSMGGNYEMTCDTKEEVIHAAFRSIKERAQRMVERVEDSK